jgi:hypothetical protein
MGTVSGDIYGGMLILTQSPDRQELDCRKGCWRQRPSTGVQAVAGSIPHSRLQQLPKNLQFVPNWVAEAAAPSSAACGTPEAQRTDNSPFTPVKCPSI